MIETVETERLVLREITVDDVDLLVELDADPAVMRFINGGKPTPSSVVAEAIPRALGQRWLAFERSTGEFVGWFGVHETSAGERELGYRLRQAAWGNGYATEGANALIAFAFTRLDAHRVWAQTMTVNTRSRRVMERCGLRFVRSFFGDWGPKFEGSEEGDVEYELTKADWKALRNVDRA